VPPLRWLKKPGADDDDDDEDNEFDDEYDEEDDEEDEDSYDEEDDEYGEDDDEEDEEDSQFYTIDDEYESSSAIKAMSDAELRKMYRFRQAKSTGPVVPAQRTWTRLPPMVRAKAMYKIGDRGETEVFAYQPGNFLVSTTAAHSFMTASFYAKIAIGGKKRAFQERVKQLPKPLDVSRLLAGQIRPSAVPGLFKDEIEFLDLNICLIETWHKYSLLATVYVLPTTFMDGHVDCILGNDFVESSQCDVILIESRQDPAKIEQLLWVEKHSRRYLEDCDDVSMLEED
jgi:hypothetical protein